MSNRNTDTLERMIVSTHLQLVGHRYRAMQAEYDDAEKKIAELYDAVYEKEYAQLTLKEKTAALRQLLENKRMELEIFQKICTALQNKLNELKMSAQ